MASQSFVHLHTHTDYSLLDGASRIDELVRLAVEDGQPALGVTDHGNLYGAIDLVDACTEAGIKPVVGMEAYLIARPDDPPVAASSKSRYHLILLATSPTGFSNLCQISSKAFLEGFDTKPCTDLATLSEHSEGLIATTACVGGIVPQMLLAGDAVGARSWAGALSDIFGGGNFFVELQDHGIGDEQKVAPELVRLGRALQLPLLATNDSHYCEPGDAGAHEALLAVQTQTTLSDPKRFRFEGEGYWLKSAAEMRQMFAEVPEACDSTLLVAERVETALPFAEPKCPSFMPGGARAEAAHLKEQVAKGVLRRYGAEPSAEVAERVEYELGVIEDMGFAGYFLIVADIVSWARSAGIGIGPGRGSAAGSLVAYCLGITDLDPLTHGLVFERFLNPGRRQMPDIDLDIDDARRSEVIAYVLDRYGTDRVAQIGTFGTIHARTAVKDAARVLGKPYALGERLSAALPALVMGRAASLRECVEGDGRDGATIRSLVSGSSDAAEVVDLALSLEGLKRSAGMHAAGVVISDRPLAGLVPLQRRLGNTDGPPVTQLDLHGVERFGLVKLDFLGLRTLGVIERAVQLARGVGHCPEPDDIPLDDPATYALLRSGRTNGVFQLESEPIQALLVELQPETFEHLVALVALYRPGPMAANMHHDYASRKNGRSKVRYPHPDFAPILADTYGLMIYQESVMRVAQHFAGYSLAEADNLRKACGKKDRDLIASERSKFVAGCVARGYGNQLGTHIFDIIEPFADYAFNKSHAAAYALISYRTAYLKAHQPESFWAAQIASVADDLDGSGHYITSAKDEGVVVLGPDVNSSSVDMSVEASDGRNAVRFGLRAVRSVGDAVAKAIAEEREAAGPYKSLEDLCDRLGSQARKPAIAALVDGGACDAFGSRPEIAARVDAACRRGREVERNASAGITSLFDAQTLEELERATPGGFAAPTEVTSDQERRDLLAAERNALGVYLSGHPLDAYCSQMDRQGILDAGKVGPEQAGDEVWQVAGVLHGVTVKAGRRGGQVTRGVLEGRHGRLRVMAFGDQAIALQHHDGDAVVCSGRVESSDERAEQLVAVSTHYLDLVCASSGEEPGGGGRVSGVDDPGGDEEPGGGGRVSGVDDPGGEWDEAWLLFRDDVSDEQLRLVAETVLTCPGTVDLCAEFAGRRFWLGSRYRSDPQRLVPALAAAGLDRWVSLTVAQGALLDPEPMVDCVA